jgi:hypothetical protein
LLLLPLALVGVGMVPLARPKPPPTQAYSPPPREDSPFSESGTFCAPSENRFPTIAPNDPRLRDKPVTVVTLMPPDSDTTALAAEAETFASLINRCGGVGGRRFDLHALAETGDPTVDCLDAATRFRPLMVVSLTASPAQQCITHDQQTILVTESDASNADLATSSGRLAATGSSEGTERARLLDLVASGRLDARTVAIVAGNSPSDTEFLQMARAVLAASRIRLGDLRHASAVLEPTLDVAAIPLLTMVTATGHRQQPLDVYGFSPATDGALEAVQQVTGGNPVQMLRTSNLFAFAPVTDASYRASRSPNTFFQMCNQAYADASAKRASSTTTTLPTDAPLSATYLQVADVCLALRIVARAAFAAGPDANQGALVAALHRLPYLDLAAPGGTPKPRPNQVVNEPVTRIAQVVVLTQVQSPCPSPSSAVAIAGASCWVPVSGWDDGGRVVNVPLTLATNGSH